MKARNFVISTVVALALVMGLKSPAQAQVSSPADPLQETFFNHVIPFYDKGSNMLSIAVFADTSFQDFPPLGAGIDLFFFDQACNVVTDFSIPLTTNDVFLLDLSDPRLASAPTQGVILATTDSIAFGGTALAVSDTCLVDTDGDGIADAPCFFITYLILVNFNDNTLVRLDSIPNDGFGTWLRYDSFNTMAASFSDSASTGIRTTISFFNAVGGSPSPAVPIGAVNTLREALGVVGTPTVGDWVVTGGSATANVTPGQIHMFTFDDDERFLASHFITLRCFERGRLSTFAPELATIFGHAFAFSIDPHDIGGGGWSAFQETVVEQGAVDMMLSGYWHHSNAVSPEPVLE